MSSFTPFSCMRCLPQGDRRLSNTRKGRLVSIFLLSATVGLPIRGLAADMEGPKVSVIAARNRVLEQSVSVVGTIVARETTLVNTDLSGARIVSIAAEEGDLVSRGQVLATLDTSRIDVELNSEPPPHLIGRWLPQDGHPHRVDCDTFKTAAARRKLQCLAIKSASFR